MDKTVHINEPGDKSVSQIKLVCFDLDGTLMDSHDTIYQTTIKTLDELKVVHKMEKIQLSGKIGHHFIDIFKELNITVEDFEHFINIYKGYYFQFIDSSLIYPDTLQLIKMLKEKNILIALLTTKAQEQADKILDHFNLTPLFDYIMGRREGIQTKPSAEPLIHICRQLGVNPENTLMVGDTELDIRCGQSAGSMTCAVTHGYRTVEVLMLEKPDFLVHDMRELAALFD